MYYPAINEHTFVTICPDCNTEHLPYEYKDAVFKCPNCGAKMIMTEENCLELARLLRELGLPYISINSKLGIRYRKEAELEVTVKFAKPYDNAMFLSLNSLFKFCNSNNGNTYRNVFGEDTPVYFGSILQYYRKITDKDLGEKINRDASNVVPLLEKVIQDLKDWCKYYKENYEGIWAIGKLAGWLDL